MNVQIASWKFLDLMRTLLSKQRRKGSGGRNMPKGMKNAQTLKKRRTLIVNLVETARAWKSARGVEACAHAEDALLDAIERLESHERVHGKTPWGKV